MMRRGLRVLPYVDDFLVLCRGPLSAIRSTEQRYVEAVLALLGLRRNCSKGVWSPTQTLEHLGIGIDTVRAVFFVTPRRLQLLSRGATALLCVAARNRSLVPRKQLASFAGLAQSLYLAIPAARHWLRSIHDCVATGGADWSRRVRLSSAARSDLGFFVRLLPQHSSRPIIRSPHTAIIHSDASKTGWGAVLNFRLPARGFWTPSQRRHHITLLEAQAVRLALQAFVDRIRGRRILLHEDNQAVVAMLTSWTSRSPALLQELRKTWRFLDLHDITLDARWIPTADNSLADALSRFRDQLGWRLHPSLSAHLLHRWGPCTRDRFADAQHHLLPVYDSLCVDPAAAGVDAFAQEDWKAFTNYCNPPFSELSRLAQLLRDTGAAAVVVAPFWPAQPWFQALSELAADSMLLPAHLCSLSPEPSPSSAPTARASWRGIAFAIPAAPLASALPPSPPSLPRYQHRGGEYRHCVPPRPRCAATVDAARRAYLTAFLGGARGPEAAAVILLAQQRLAPSTSSSYRTKWRLFEQFCTDHELLALPASSATVVQWVASLFLSGKVQPQSLQPYLSAVNDAHRAGGFDLPAHGDVLAAVRRGWAQRRASLQPEQLRFSSSRSLPATPSQRCVTLLAALHRRSA